MKKFIFSVFLFSCVAFFACGDDNLDDCTAASFSSEINAAITALNSAGQTYVSDPSSANCEAYRDAASDYLDAVEDLDGCAGISANDYEAALQQARDAVDAIQC